MLAIFLGRSPRFKVTYGRGKSRKKRGTPQEGSGEKEGGGAKESWYFWLIPQFEKSKVNSPEGRVRLAHPSTSSRVVRRRPLRRKKDRDNISLGLQAIKGKEVFRFSRSAAQGGKRHPRGGRENRSVRYKGAWGGGPFRIRAITLT